MDFDWMEAESTVDEKEEIISKSPYVYEKAIYRPSACLTGYSLLFLL